MTKYQESYHDLARRIRELFKKGPVDVEPSKHARIEMRNDNLTLPDIVNVLKRCSVIQVEGIGENALYRCHGKTSDWVLINVVIKVNEIEGHIYIVTVFSIKH